MTELLRVGFPALHGAEIGLEMERAVRERGLHGAARCGAQLRAMP